MLDTAKTQKSDLPFGSQFSPVQVDLRRILDIVSQSGGTTPNFAEHVRAEFFSRHAKGDVEQQQEIAKNLRLSLRAYQIIGEDEQFTQFGKELYNTRNDESTFYAMFGRHILLNLKGIALLRAIASLKALHEQPTLLAIARELERGGIHVPPSGTHVSSMKQWLQKAGVLDARLDVDDKRLRDLVGYGLEDLDQFAGFTPEQRAFIQALASLAPSDWISSAEVARHAEAKSHVEYNPKDLRHQVIFPLRDQGFLDVRKSTSGRGAKPYEVRPTQKFRAEFLLPLLETLRKSGDISQDLLRKPIAEIVDDLESDQKLVKGKALELLAMHLCRLLGLRIVAWRHRWQETGGAEVDVLAEGTNFTFTRWEIQCKNTPKVGLNDIAREVGIAEFYHANIVMLVTTGSFAKPAIDFAEKKMEKSSLHIVLLEGSDLRRIVASPSSVSQVLRRFAQQAMKLKKLKDVGATESDNG